MIYLIKAEETNLYKIGYTAGKAKDRLKSMQTGCPHKLSVVEEFEGCLDKERSLHDTFSEYRKQGEWFELDNNTLDKVIEKMSKEDEASIEDIESWRSHYEKALRNSACGINNFIMLSILEIMSGRHDIAIQRLLEYNSIAFNSGRPKCVPDLDEIIWRTK